MVRGYSGMMDNLRKGEIYTPEDTPGGPLLSYKAMIRRASLDVDDYDVFAAAGAIENVQLYEVITTRDSQPCPSSRWVIRDLLTNQDWVVQRATRTAAGAIYACICVLRQRGSAES